MGFVAWQSLQHLVGHAFRFFHQLEEGAHGGGDAVLAGDEGGMADVALRRQRQADQIRELAGGSGEAGTDDGPAQPVAHGTHQVKQGVGFQHHVKPDAGPLGGAVQILAKLHGAAGQYQRPLLQCRQGQLIAGEALIRLVAVHQHGHLVVALGIEVEGLSGGAGKRLVKPQPDVALVQLQL